LPDSPIVLQADPQRLQQLLENLLSHILARCKPAQPLQIAVSDDGKRMMARFTLPLTSTPARRPSGPFPRASGGTTSLALAQALAQRQAGTLAALDESGGHTGFVLHLPLGEMTPATAAPAMRTRLRVLSIEDNWDFAQLFQHMLQIMGCELEMTSDAEAGLKLAREGSPQLIFCDIGLPGDMDGYDFARKLRADPALAHLPLVAVSAYCTPDDVKRALEAGFDRVCGKPVKFAEISAALSAFSNGTLRNF
jgi:CheY-like chemotaxis protein